MTPDIDQVPRIGTLGNLKYEWQAFVGRNMLLHVWTRGCGSFAVELDVFRARLDRGDFTHVKVYTREDPKLRWTLFP